jgi:hypothetical protein
MSAFGNSRGLRRHVTVGRFSGAMRGHSADLGTLRTNTRTVGMAEKGAVARPNAAAGTHVQR